MSTDHFATDGAKTKQNEIVVLSPQPQRRAFNGQYRPSASFVAQVIAAKTGAPTYRQKRRASANEAEMAYQANDERKIVRMPMGYLRTLDA